MGLQGPTTASWFERATGALVNGVSSGWRFWSADDTLVIDRGEGGHIYDMDGRRYVDFQLGFGPIILGHADPRVTAAVDEAAAAGTVFAMTQRREVEAAEAVKRAVSWVDRLRFTNTGTEATMHAIRLARAVTGRDLILKFEGQYHGAHDYVMYSTPGADLVALGNREHPQAVPMSRGMPEVVANLIRTLPFNDVEAAKHAFEADGQRIAAVMVEPMLGNVMGIQPVPGFLETLRDLCDRHGSVLVFDEVKTGFRIGVGGAAEAYGVEPDLAAFAKALGNGFPVAAIAGRDSVLDGWTDQRTIQAGTYSGNGIAVAAAHATVDVLMTGNPLARVEAVGRALMEGIERILRDRGQPGTVIGHPSMVGIYLGEGSPTELRATGGHDHDLYERIIMGMIHRGVMPCPDALEPWFVCAAHTDDDVAEALAAFDSALQEAVG